MALPAIAAFIVQAMSLIPKLIELGQDVAPLIVSGRNAVNEMKAGKLLPASEIAAVDSTVAQFETEFKDAVAAHLAKVAAG